MHYLKKKKKSFIKVWIHSTLISMIVYYIDIFMPHIINSTQLPKQFHPWNFPNLDFLKIIRTSLGSLIFYPYCALQHY